jgi:hypothetical protein
MSAALSAGPYGFPVVANLAVKQFQQLLKRIRRTVLIFTVRRILFIE